MDDKKLNEAKFDAMIRMAVIENFEEEMAEIPPRNELEKIYMFSEYHKRRMRRLFAYARRKDVYKMIRKITYRIAAVLLVMVSLLFGMLMTNANVRAEVRRMLIEWFNTHTNFRFLESKMDTDVDINVDWRPTYLPEGFVENDIYIGITRKSIEYTNANGDEISFIYMLADASSISVDNEHSNYFVEKYGDIKYHVFVSNNDEYPSHIIWEYESFAFRLEAIFDYNELLKMAFSIQKK